MGDAPREEYDLGHVVVIGAGPQFRRILKEIIKHLHRGGSPDEVRGKLRAVVRETDASEIAAMEQALMGVGMRVEEIRSNYDLHASVLKEVLIHIAPAQTAPTLVPGHPVDTFQRENRTLRGAVARMRAATQAVTVFPESALPPPKTL
jgi:DUF438 domain-containing protein